MYGYARIVCPTLVIRRDHAYHPRAWFLMMLRLHKVAYAFCLDFRSPVRPQSSEGFSWGTWRQCPRWMTPCLERLVKTVDDN